MKPTSRSLRRSVAAAGLVAGLLASAAGSAGAATVRCGDVLTTSTSLDADVLDCTDTAIVAGADGITINLKGHRVTQSEEVYSQVDGIDAAGHRGVRVVNGEVSGFNGCAVRLDGPSNVARDLRLRRVFSGVCVTGDDSVVGPLSVSGALDAAVLEDGARGVTITGAVIRDGGGIDLDRSAPGGDNRIVGNRLINAGIQSQFQTDDVIADNVLTGGGGMLISSHGPGTRIIRNVVRDAFSTGIALFGPGLVAGNRIIRGSGGGIAVAFTRFEPDAAPFVVVRDNVVQLVRSSGIDVQLSRNALVQDNVSGALRPGGGGGNARGISVGGSDDTRLVGNRVIGNSEDGVHVGEATTGTRLVGNRAAANGDDGFEVAEPTAVLNGNLAIRNSGWGFLAVDGVTGTGNQAGSNVLGQCTPAPLCG